jgi:selenocysteine lyase/cysteine desulfurase
MKIANQRHLFDIPEDVTYLNCAYMSPLMHRVIDAGVEGLSRKGRPWEIHPPDFFTGSDALRAAFAKLVNARPEDVAIVAAASYGISLAAKNLRLAKGQTVLVLADQFPSNVFPWRERAREVGASVVTVPRPEDSDWTAAVLDTIDETTATLALPQCHWTDGTLLNLEQISDACRERGIALALDVTQSAGVFPIDVERIQPDFLTAATYKWLMGPYSLALLYVAPKWQREGRGLEHNWIHRKGADNFARLVDYQDEFAEGALRFDVGERSNFALVPAATTAIEQVLEWGVENISETVGHLTERILAGVEEFGVRAPRIPARAPHYLGLRLGGEPPPGLPARLAEEKVFVSIRGSSVRVTPHVYNSEADADRFVRVLKSALE